MAATASETAIIKLLSAISKVKLPSRMSDCIAWNAKRNTQMLSTSFVSIFES